MTTGSSNVIIASPNPQQQQQSQEMSAQSQTNQSMQQQQQIKIVQPGLTTQQLVNAKLINVQGIGNKAIKTTGGIK